MTDHKMPTIKPDSDNEISIRFYDDKFDDIYVKTKVHVLAVYNSAQMPIILVKMPDGTVQDFYWNGNEGCFKFLTLSEENMTFKVAWQDDERINQVMTMPEWNKYAECKPSKMWIYDATQWPYPAKFDSEIHTEDEIKDFSENVTFVKPY